VNDAVRIALAYRATGWMNIVPAQGKRPALAAWKHLEFRPPTEEEVRAIWGVPRPPGFGKFLGERVACVDVDVRPDLDGRDTMHELETEHGELPLSPRALSPSEGWHHYLAVPEGVDEEQLPTKLGKGVALRHGRLFMALPPAPGREWEHDPEEVALAPLPQWIIDLGRVDGGAGKGNHVPPVGLVPYGERYDYLVDAGVHLVRGGMVDEAVLLEHLLFEFERRCEQHPPREPGNIEQLAHDLAHGPIARERRTTMAFAARMFGYRRPGSERPGQRADAAANGGAPAAVEAIRRALLDDPADLAAAMRGDRPARDMVPGSNGLVARGIAHTLFGARGSGKSFVMAVLGASMAHAGERVLVLDRENGDGVAAERFSCILDAHPEWEHVIDDGQFVGKHYPALDPRWNGADVAEALDGFTIVMFDSTREFLGQLGGGNNDDDAVTLLWNTAVTPLLRRGVAVLLADNTGHQHPGRPKGAGGKMDAAPQIYRVEPVSEFTPTLTGELRLTCTRSRFGDIDRTWIARLGDNVYEVPASDSQAPDAERYRHARAKRDAFRAAVERVLEPLSESLSANRLLDELKERGAGVRRAKGLAWLRDLVDDAGSRVAEDKNGFYMLKTGPSPRWFPAARTRGSARPEPALREPREKELAE
jgi:hypothetical protein